MPRGRKRKSDILAGEAVSESGIGPVDVHVGSRIAARRKLLQLSQTELADKLGITFQQVQKYEKGVNRIGAGRLFSIASILGVDINYFYSDIEANAYSQLFDFNQNLNVGFLQEDITDQQFDPINGAEATMLLKAFYALPPKARSALLMMLVSLREKYDDESDA
jgi:transcriptional regulator with XRE-family HTH domain